MYLLGTVLGFTRSLVPKRGNSVKSPEASWIPSLSNICQHVGSFIGQLVGSLLMGVVAGAIGREKAIILFCLPLLIGLMFIISYIIKCVLY